MSKRILTFSVCLLFMSTCYTVQAQSDKNKKSRYYQNNTTNPEEFNVDGFVREPERKEIEKKTEENEYDVKVKSGESDSKYYDEKRVQTREERQAARAERRRHRADAYPTTYGGKRVYNSSRNKYDRYYDGSTPPPPPPPVEAPAPVAVETTPPPPPPPPPVEKKKVKAVKPKQVEEREIGMTPNEVEYKTTVVKKRYTNLDVLCDDLDLAKIQRPVFKGICSECSRDVDKIIVDKNLSSLEKNYRLKQCYMLRDKRLRETLDDDQYRKFIRIKDQDEYLVITKDLELKDGVNR